MLKKFYAFPLVVALFSTASADTIFEIATDFKRTTGSILEDMEKRQNDQELTSKLTRLRDLGGYTPNRATACISFKKYEQYLRASWGVDNFYPTKEECWPTEYNQPVRATENCSYASADYTTDSAYSTLVCEFETEGWFSSNVWIRVESVEPK